MNEGGEIVSRGYWTGATDKSNIGYNVNRDCSWDPNKKIFEIIIEEKDRFTALNYKQ